MVYLRHATRHVHETIANHIRSYMNSLGWLGPDGSVPFGTTPARFQVGRMDEATIKQVTGNLIAISFGDEPDKEEIEMGGGLLMQQYVVFVDLLSDHDAIALAMASDVKDLLQGAAPGTSRFTYVHDYTNAPPPVPQLDHQLEFVEVERRKPDVSWRHNWHVVNVTVEMIHPEWG